MIIRDTEKSFDILTFSDMCVDLILSGEDVTPKFGQVEKLVEDYTLELGGSCNIFACQAARLGLRTAVLGRVGDDDFGRLILRRLGECGVDTRYVMVDSSLKTGLGVALCPAGDRAILTYMGTINAVYPQDIDDGILAATRHVHHASYFLHTNLQSGMAEIFARAHRLGASTSLDTNWDPEERWENGLPGVLAHTDIFLPNDQEALQISRASTLSGAAKHFLQAGVSLVGIKCGSQGSWVYSTEAAMERKVNPAQVGGDSIGAGDSYDAGFLAGWLRGMSLRQCQAIASACGRSVAGKIGGLAGQLDWDEVSGL